MNYFKSNQSNNTLLNEVNATRISLKHLLIIYTTDIKQF